MRPNVVVPAEPDRADRALILARLIECEAAAAGPPEIEALAVLLKDEAQRTIGGLWGTTVFRWLVVEYVLVPDECRGLGIGRDLMQRAEAIARQRNCIGIWLDTYTFQARGFYEKLGFTVFGAVEEHPPGQQRLFLKKRLT